MLPLTRFIIVLVELRHQPRDLSVIVDRDKRHKNRTNRRVPLSRGEFHFAVKLLMFASYLSFRRGKMRILPLIKKKKKIQR